jgi:hypothetical protein
MFVARIFCERVERNGTDVWLEGGKQSVKKKNVDASVARIFAVKRVEREWMCDINI